jgi:hypothetical protein
MSDTTQVQLLVHFEAVGLIDANSGNPIFPSVPLSVLLSNPTEAERVAVCQQVGTTVALPNAPIVVAVCQQFKIPICQAVPVSASHPDYLFELPGARLVVHILEGTPDELVTAWQNILRTYTTVTAAGALTVAPAPASQDKISTKIATGLTVGGLFAANAIRKGAQLAQSGIEKGTTKVVQSTTPCEAEVCVPQGYLVGVRQAKAVSACAVGVSVGMSTAMIAVTAAISDHAAAKIASRVPQGSPSTQGGKLGALKDGLKEVGLAGLGAAGAVLAATDQATMEILSASTEGIATVVHHRYGAQARDAALETMDVAKNIVKASTAMESAGFKAILKSTAKQTAQKVGTQLQ